MSSCGNLHFKTGKNNRCICFILQEIKAVTNNNRGLGVHTVPLKYVKQRTNFFCQFAWVEQCYGKWSKAGNFLSFNYENKQNITEIICRKTQGKNVLFVSKVHKSSL